MMLEQFLQWQEVYVGVVYFLWIIIITTTTNNLVKNSMSWFGNWRCEFIDLSYMID